MCLVVHWWSIQEKLLADSTTNPKNFWKEIGKMGIAKERTPRIPMEDGSVSKDFDDIHKSLDDLLFNVPITMEEIASALGHEKNGKACGTDGLPVEMLRNGTALRFLYVIFNVAFSLVSFLRYGESV